MGGEKGLRCRFDEREKNGKGGKFSGSAFTGNLSMQFLRDEIMHNIHPQPTSSLVAFRGKKRIKHFGALFRIHSLSIIAIFKHECGGVFSHCQSNFSFLNTIKSMNKGINHQIAENL